METEVRQVQRQLEHADFMNVRHRAGTSMLEGSPGPALLTVGVAVALALAVQSSCKGFVHCPCGKSGGNVTVCLQEDNATENPCSKLAGCGKCQDGLDGCLECPEGFEGPFCEKGNPSDNADASYCKTPGPVANGRVSPNPPPSEGGRPQGSGDEQYPEGSRLQYSCDAGYTLRGTQTLTCRSSGVWSDTPPKCIAVTDTVVHCLNPGSIENGRVTYIPNYSDRTTAQASPNDPEYPEGTSLLYTCNTGYTLIGSLLLTCEKSGKWSSERPTCSPDPVVHCLNSGYIENGRVTYIPNYSDRRSSPNDPEYPEGASLLYTCNSGYTLIGSLLLTCEKSGKWSSERPVCSPDTVVHCLNPGSIENGKVTYVPNYSDRRTGQATPNDSEYPEGTSLLYTCNSGYTLLGESPILTCEESGKWSSQRPVCSPGQSVSYCDNPGRIPNGKVVLYPISTRRTRGPSPFTLEDPKYPPGTRLQYRCNSGFTLNGSSSMTCKASGLWSTDLPICRRGNETNNADASYCKTPGPVANGRVSHNPPPNEGERPQVSGDEQYPEGSRLQYSCDAGYTLRGTQTLTCRSSGAWSDTPPKCIAATVPGGEVLYCDNPGIISNGRIRYRPPVSFPRYASSVDVEDVREFPKDARLEYSCNDGYSLVGRFSLRCEPNGMWSSSPPTCTEECGRSLMQMNRKIIHGNKTTAGEWPWVVALAVREGNALVVKCGAALLNSRTIVTTAHCLTIADSFTLYFGKFHLWKNDSDVKVARSERVIIHPDYSRETMDSDIGLVTFSPRIRFTERIQPICLPSPETSAKNLVPGKRGYVTGWGLTNFSLPSEELLLARLPVMTNDACVESYRRQDLQFDMTSNMFCAGFEDGRQDVCKGDAGSPLVFYDKNTDKHTVEGLVSFGVVGQCGIPGRYSAFTKVSRFVPWILRNT